VDDCRLSLLDGGSERLTRLLLIAFDALNCRP
jgi:hypothetical protein